MREIEVKIAVGDADDARALLGRKGAVALTPRYFEDNRVYDDDSGSLRASDRLLRLRSVGSRHVLTFKKPPRGELPDRTYKVLDEHETIVTNPAETGEILAGLGMRVVFRYQKFRQRYRLDGHEVELDETPVGVFLELEGTPEWIDSTARALGFSREHYITKTYRAIQQEVAGDEAGDLVFARGADE